MAKAPRIPTWLSRIIDSYQQSRLGRTVTHYLAHEGNVSARAMTYSGFLSFFPILAIALTIASYVAFIYPDVESIVETAIEMLIPGIIGEGQGQISLNDISSAGAATTTIGLLVLVFTGSNWMRAMRTGLNRMGDITKSDEPHFFFGAAKDLALLIVFLIVMGVSVAASSFVMRVVPGPQRFFAPIVGLIVGVALFVFLFRFVPDQKLPLRTVAVGAVISALAFEVLKFVMVQIIGGVAGSPLATLAIAATILVWINNFSRIALFGFAWSVIHDTVRH